MTAGSNARNNSPAHVTLADEIVFELLAYKCRISRRWRQDAHSGDGVWHEERTALHRSNRVSLTRTSSRKRREFSWDVAAEGGSVGGWHCEMLVKVSWVRRQKIVVAPIGRLTGAVWPSSACGVGVVQYLQRHHHGLDFHAVACITYSFIK